MRGIRIKKEGSMAREVLKQYMKAWGAQLEFVFLIMLVPVMVILFFIAIIAMTVVFG